LPNICFRVTLVYAPNNTSCTKKGLKMTTYRTKIVKIIGVWIVLLIVFMFNYSNIAITVAAEPDSSLPDHITDLIVPDGIYAIINVASEKWMDVRYNSSVPGAHMQQYAYPSSPADGNAPYGLYRITRIEDSGRYVIRLLLNETLTFEYVGDEITTKVIPALDREVAPEDTYRIVPRGDGHYTLQQYGEESYICCGDLDASGSASGTRSYLTTTTSKTSSVSQWMLQPYQKMLKTGAYWISNDVSIPIGTNPRIMDAEGPSFAEGTVIQQWKSPNPDPIMYHPQIWIVRNIGCGYYTISHSRKFDMYMSYHNDAIRLNECMDSDVGEEYSIQWKIEGNTQSGYCITSRSDPTKSIAAPTSTANGQNLTYASAPVENNGLNLWDFNRIDEVYIMSICTSYNTSFHIDENGNEVGQHPLDFGHSWIKFENLSILEITFGSAPVDYNEHITVGGWGNQRPDQMWYNLERYFASNMTTDTYGRYISVLIRKDKLLLASNYIRQKQANDWTIIFQNNCVNFATGLWREVMGSGFENISATPEALYTAMGSYSYCIDGIVTTRGEWQGYYKDDKLHKVDSSDISNIPSSAATFPNNLIVNDPYVTKGIAEDTTLSIDLEKATDAHIELRTEIIQEKENDNHD